MNQENIYQLISVLLKHKKYYNFKRLDKYFYLSGNFTLDDQTILAFHNIFGKFVSNDYDYYLWTVCHEYLVNKGLIHDDLKHKHILNQNELMIPSSLIAEISELIKGMDIELIPYCQVKKEHLFLMGGNLVLDNYIESNVSWNIS